MKSLLIRLFVGTAFAILGTAVNSASDRRAAPVPVAPTMMLRIATVDARYQSYNVEMAEVIGGNFWKPYAKSAKAAPKAGSAPATAMSGDTVPQVGVDPTMFEARPPVDLSRTRLRTPAAQEPEDTPVRLNGRELNLGANAALPALQGRHIPAGRVRLAPLSITFLTMAEAGNANCP